MQRLQPKKPLLYRLTAARPKNLEPSLRQAYENWEALRADPKTRRDEGGPAHSRLRLEIPAFLLGKDFYENKQSSYQEREIEQRGDPAS